MATFGERLRLIRNRKNITLDVLAEKIHSTKATLSRYENSKRTPNIEFAKKIADYFEVTADYMLGLTDNENEEISKYDDIIGFAEKSSVNAKVLRDYIQFLDGQNNKKD